MGRLQSAPRTQCVDKSKIINFLSGLAEVMNQNCDKVWVTKKNPGELEFLLDGERITIKTTSVKSAAL